MLSVSIGRGPKRERFRWQLAALMLCAGFVLSLSTLIFKAFAVKDEFWATTFWMFAGEALFGVAFLCIGRYRRQFFDLLRSNGGALIAINASNELINLGGGLANRYALIFAPLAIVQAIGSTTTLFVFLIGVLLTLVAPSISRENLSAREFVQKGIAAVLVAIGVTLVQPLDLRQLVGRLGEHLVERHLPHRQALLERIARQRFQRQLVLVRAVGPVVLAHHLARMIVGMHRPRQGRVQMADLGELVPCTAPWP